MEENNSHGGMERRSFLKRAAIVGGATVWATPTVQSLVAPAFATGTGLCPPDRIWRFKYDVDNNMFDSGDASGGGANWCLPDGYADAVNSVPNVVGNVASFTVDGKTYTITITLLDDKTAQVMISGGAIVEDLVAKAGSNSNGECDEIHEYVDPNTAVLQLQSKGISFVAGVICIPT